MLRPTTGGHTTSKLSSLYMLVDVHARCLTPACPGPAGPKNSKKQIEPIFDLVIVFEHQGEYQQKKGAKECR